MNSAFPLMISNTNQEETTRYTWFLVIVGVLFFIFMFFWLPFTNRIAARLKKRIEQVLGVKIEYTYKSAWKVEEHFIKSILVGVLQLIFIVIFWLGPFLLLGSALLLYYWLYGFPK